MYGQYRSKLDCPKCNKVSIIFDPFMMIPLPIPQDNRETVNIRFQETPTDTTVFPAYYEKDTGTVEELLNSIGSKLANPVPGTSLVAFESNHSCRILPSKAELSNELRYVREISVRRLLPSENMTDGLRLTVTFCTLASHLYSNSTKQFGTKRVYFFPSLTKAK